MNTIFPLLIIIVVVIVVFRFNWGMKRGSSSYVKRIRMILASYLAILLVCAGVDAVLPAKGRHAVNKVDAQEVTQESDDLYNTAVNGGIDKIDQKFLVKKWNFDYQGDMLKVDSTSSEFYSLYVVVDRKTESDGKIEASYFRSRASMNDMEITSLIKSPNVKLEGGVLNIIPPVKSKITYYQFANVFSIKQFTGEKYQTFSNFNDGQMILYLQIPKNLKIDIPENGFPWHELEK